MTSRKSWMGRAFSATRFFTTPLSDIGKIGISDGILGTRVH